MDFKQVVIVQGWKSKPADNWAPWLKKELDARGVLTSIPALSRAEVPNPADWLVAIRTFMYGKPDKHVFFVTHSLGCRATLLFLEQLPKETRIGGLVIVAGFSEWNGRPESTDFFARPLHYKKICRMMTNGIVAIQSTDDPFVPYKKNTAILQKKLKAKLITIENGGHLNTSIGGYTKLPVVLDELIKMGC